MSSSSVCNHIRDKQIRLPRRGSPILLITRMITDRIGLHSVLPVLPLYTRELRYQQKRDCTLLNFSLHDANKTVDTFVNGSFLIHLYFYIKQILSHNYLTAIYILQLLTIYIHWY